VIIRKHCDANDSNHGNDVTDVRACTLDLAKMATSSSACVDSVEEKRDL